MTEKTCADCRECKPISEFYTHPTNSTGYNSYCKPCSTIRGRRHREKYPTRKKELDLWNKYGVTWMAYMQMLTVQASGCAICGGKPDGRWGVLHVDHCHDTGKVRGLLCNRCNMGIGYFRDQPDLLHSAACYLEECQEYGET